MVEEFDGDEVFRAPEEADEEAPVGDPEDGDVDPKSDEEAPLGPEVAVLSDEAWEGIAAPQAPAPVEAEPAPAPEPEPGTFEGGGDRCGCAAEGFSHRCVPAGRRRSPSMDDGVWVDAWPMNRS